MLMWLQFYCYSIMRNSADLASSSDEGEVVSAVTASKLVEMLKEVC